MAHDPLTALDTIDWKSLEHAHGSAEDLPETIRRTSGAVATALEAVDTLRSRLADIENSPASTVAAPILLDIAASDVPAAGALLRLVTDMAFGDDLETLRQGVDLSNQSVVASLTPRERQIVAALSERVDVLKQLLRSREASTRAGAAYALAPLGEADSVEAGVAALAESLDCEEDDSVAATMTLAVAALGRIGGSAGVTKLLKKQLADSNDLKRAAAALALSLAGKKVDHAALAEAARLGPLEPLLFPWLGGEFWLLALMQLKARKAPSEVLGAAAKEALSKFAESGARNRDKAQQTRMGQALTLLHEALFARLKGRFKNAVLPEELDTEERRALEDLAQAEMGGLKAYGLPVSARAIRRFFSEDHPLNARVELAGASVPIWKGLEAVVAKRAKAAELADAMRACTNRATAHAALCEALRYPNEVSPPFPVLTADISAWAAEDALVEAERFFGELREQSVRWQKQSFDCAFLPFACTKKLDAGMMAMLEANPQFVSEPLSQAIG